MKNNPSETNDVLKELSNNLNMLMAKTRITSNELARQIGIPATTIKRIRNYEQANPTVNTLLPIARYFALTIDQLIGYAPIPPDSDSIKMMNGYKIPLLSWSECFRYISSNYKTKSKHIYTERQVSPKAFGLLLEDDGVEYFPKNCILIVEPEIKPVSGDYVIIGNAKQDIISIRKYFIDIDQIYLKPLVAGVAITKLTSENTVVGVILQSKVDLKT